MLSADLSYTSLLASRFNAVLNDPCLDQMNEAWKIVTEQQNRKDVLDAAALFYKYFAKNPRTITIYFIDGPQEFGASQIECFKKESPALEKMLVEGNRIALKREEFAAAMNSHSPSLEAAYYLNIARLIKEAEKKIVDDIKYVKKLSDYQSGLEIYEKLHASHLKNCPFIRGIIENELAELFGQALLVYSKCKDSISRRLEAYREKKIEAISLSFESDSARSIVNAIATIDSLKVMKVDSFSLKDSELSFPRHITHLELINTTDLSVESLKAIPVTVISLKLIGTRFKGQDLQFLPPSLTRLILTEVFCGLTAVLLPRSLNYLEFNNCIDFTDDWLKSLPDLSTLIIRNCPKITGKSLLSLPGSIEHLEIINVKANDEDLVNLPASLHTLRLPDSLIRSAVHLSNIGKLDLSGTAITDQGVKNLSDKLSELNVSRCKVQGATLNRLQHLTHLYLEGCPIERPNLCQISRSVTHLSLTIEILDEDIAYLPNKLHEVVLNGAKLTSNGWIRLPRSIHQIRIIGLKILREEVERLLPEGISVQA